MNSYRLRCAVLVAALMVFTSGALAGVITFPGTGGAIPDNATLAQDIVVSDLSTILGAGQNVSITFNSLSHTWMGDLSATLEHVGYGGAASVFYRVGVPGSTFGSSSDLSGTYAFNNDFTDSFWAAAGVTPVPGGNYYPTSAGSSAETAFSDLWNGQPVAGTWHLAITDNAGGDTGSLGSWDLSFNVQDSAVPEPATFALLSAGLLALRILRRRRA